ncbi:MAG: hypothetical protein ACAI43_14570 [Phycisphaerae bacterium]|nr:hypothetical protein [Tepidisphaeraceae bacterium]
MTALVGAASPALLIAAMDLKLVRLIRGAMAAADLAAGKCGSAHPLGPDPEPEFNTRRHLTPTPVYEPRRHIHPTPKFEPRPVIHLRPRVVVDPPIRVPAEPCLHPDAGSKLPPPPWKLPPCQPVPAQPVQKVKLVRLKPDIVRTGTMIDCFM